MLQVFSQTALRSAKQTATQPNRVHHHHRLSRTFFASSTDHSTLLQNAEIHKLLVEGIISDTATYVLAAEGVESNMVQKVPQLHLARLYLRQDATTATSILFGAKVVNSTLGAPKDVCGRLVDAALQDGGSTVRAQSSLRGLSEWVQDGLNQPQNSSCETLASLDDATVQVLRDGMVAYDTDNKSKNPDKNAALFESVWDKLARDFLQQKLGDEAALYQSKGGVLSEIIHHADDSDYARSSGGSMAMFTMSLS